MFQAKDDEDDGGTSPLVTTESKTETDQQSTAIDVTATDLIPNLTPENVADLVLLSMVCRAFYYLFWQKLHYAPSSTVCRFKSEIYSRDESRISDSFCSISNSRQFVL